MSTRKERLYRHQAAEAARGRLKSGAYDQPQGPYKSTRLRNLEAYNEQHAPLPSSFSGDPETAMLNVPNAIKSFQATHTTPGFLQAKPSAPSVQDLMAGKQQIGSAQALQSFTASHPAPDLRSRNEQLGDKARGLPIIGAGIKALDWLSEKTKPAADIAQELYTPGAGLGVLNAADQAGMNLVSRLLPKVETAAFKASPKAAYAVRQAAPLVGRAATEAGIGAVTGGGQMLAAHPEQGFKGAAEGALQGAVGGAALPVVGKGVKWAAEKAGLAKLFKRNGIPDNEIDEILNGDQPEPLGLPPGREDKFPHKNGPVNGTEPIIPEYTFKLPEAQESTLSAARNGDNARKDLSEIDTQIQKHKDSYEEAVIKEYKYLRESMGQKASKGHTITDPVTSEVKDKIGSISGNPKWYQEISNKANGYKKPTLKELYELARKRVDEGFTDEQGAVPSWKAENNYDDTLTALNETREQMAKGIREVDPPIKMTNAKLKDTVFKSKRTPGDTPFATPEAEPAAAPGTGEAAEGGKPKGRKVRRKPAAASEGQAFTKAADDTQNYAGNQIPYRQAATQDERTIARNQVVKNMRKNLGVVIDTGRLSTKNKNVLGQYKIKPEVVRSRMAEDLQVISHEIGHHLDKKYKLVSNTQYHGELQNLLHQTGIVNTAAYQPSQLAEEGIAEYVRLRLTDPDKAHQLAPGFTRFFDSELGPKALKGFEASAKDVDTWITQGDYNQAMGLLDFDSGSKKKKFSWERTYTKFVDDLNPLKLVEKALNKTIGVGKDSIYKMARISRGVGERAKLAIKRGIYDDSGKKISDGLAQIVKPLEKLGVSEKDFSLYMAVRHAQDLKGTHGKMIPWTDAQMDAVMKKLDSPELRAVHTEVMKYNNALLDLMVDAQLLTKKAVTEMRSKYPNYVPFQRYFDDDAVAGFKDGGFGASKGFANLTNPIKRMSEEGSLRTVVNPIEGIIKNTMLVMNAAAKNKVGLQLAELSEKEGAGAWVEGVSQLTKNGRVVKGTGSASKGSHEITVSINGEKQAFKIRDPELYNAMLSLDTESSNAVIKFLGGAASMLRAGAVLTPEFIVRNAFRDALGALINSTKYGFNPLDYFKGLGHVLGKSETFDKFLSSGGAMSTLQSLDRDANREMMEGVFRRSLKDKTLNIVTSPKELVKFFTGYTPVKATVGLLRKGAEISEFSTKVGLYNKVLKKTGSMEEAAYAARDLMDFNRAGSSVRQWNRVTAFLNASIQGTDKMARSFKENPASFLTRSAVTLVAPAVGLYYWNKNLPPDMRKQYENIPQWQKDNFFIIGVPHMGEFIRIPKPFEAGMLFSTGTERMLEHFDAHNPEASKNYGKTLLNTFTPPAMITALTPVLEAITNYSFFTGNPIVNQGDQRFEKKDQYGLYTSETAKGIGKLLSHTPLKNTNFASPKIIDNTIKGYTAGLGGYGVSLADVGINKAYGTPGVSKTLDKVGLGREEEGTLPSKKITEQPVAKAFFVNTAGGGQVRDDFYKAWGRVSAKKASADKNEKPFNDPTYAQLNAGKKMIDKLNKQYKAIQNDKLLSGNQKRLKLDAIDKQMNEIAAKSLGK